MVFNATFNKISVISWRSVLLVEGTGVPSENHRPVASYWQTLSHNVGCIEYTSPWTGFELTALVVIGTDCIGSYKSNYHTITTTMAPRRVRWNYQPVITGIKLSRDQASSPRPLKFGLGPWKFPCTKSVLDPKIFCWATKIVI